MPLSDDALAHYVAVSSGVDLSPNAVTRVRQGVENAARSLEIIAGDSLFDTEAVQLHAVLESLADTPGEDTP